MMRMNMKSYASILLARAAMSVLWLACGDSPGPMSLDMGETRDGGQLLAPPTLPMLTPCAEGWVPVEDHCEPPLTSSESCAEGSFPIPGVGGCVTVGASCPEGDFAPDVPEPALYVSAGSGPQGNGTRSAPLRSIAAATAMASAGFTIVLSAGVFEELVILPDGVSLIGACSTRTTVRTESESNEAGVVIIVGESTVANLRIEGTRPGIAVSRSGDATVTGVVIDGASLAGALVAGGRLDARDIAIARTAPVQTSGPFGMALFAREGSSVTVANAWLEANAYSGVLATGAQVSLTNIAIVGTAQQATSDQPLGSAVVVAAAAGVRLDRGYFRDNGTATLAAFDASSSLEAADVVVASTKPSEQDGTLGRGLYLAGGSQAVFRRAFFSQNRSSAIAVLSDSQLTLSDTVIRATGCDDARAFFGHALYVESGAAATVERLAVVDNAGRALVVRDPGSLLSLTDTTVTDGKGECGPEGSEGTGLHVQEGATATAERLYIRDAHGAAVIVVGAEASATLSQVSLLDTRQRACAPGCAELALGDAVVAAIEGQVTLTQFEIGRSARVGVHVVNGTADLHDGVIFENLIGANVSRTDFDASRLSDRVVYRDNERNFASTSLPTPPIPVF